VVGVADATVVIVAAGTAAVVVAAIVAVVVGAVVVARVVEVTKAARVARVERASVAEVVDARRRGTDGCGAKGLKALCMVAAFSSRGTRMASCAAPKERTGGCAVAQLIES